MNSLPGASGPELISFPLNNLEGKKASRRGLALLFTGTGLALRSVDEIILEEADLDAATADVLGARIG